MGLSRLGAQDQDSIGQNLSKPLDEKVQGERTTILLIYDSEGNLAAESNGASEFAFGLEDAAMPVKSEICNAADCAEVFIQGSDLTSWLTSQFDQARKHESYRAQSSLEHPGGKVNVRLETLRFP